VPRAAPRSATQRLPARLEAEPALAEELRLVEHHGLSGFFLVYHDLFDLAREVAADVRPARGGRTSACFPVAAAARPFLRRVLPARPLAHRSGRHPALHRAVPETRPSLGADIDLDFPREIAKS